MGGPPDDAANAGGSGGGSKDALLTASATLTGGGVHLVATATDGSTVENPSWSFIADTFATVQGDTTSPVAAPSDQAAAPEPQGSSGSRVPPGVQQVAPDRWRLPDRRVVGPGLYVVHSGPDVRPTRVSASTVRMSPPPRSAPTRAASAAAPAAIDACLDMADCVTSAPPGSGTYVVMATVDGKLLSASARLEVSRCTAGDLEILEAGGPNPHGSFTTKADEHTVTMRAQATGGCSAFADSIRWDVRDAPNDQVKSYAPDPASLGRGPVISWDVPVPQDVSRWSKTQHPGTLGEKSLAFEVAASVVDDAGHEVDSQTDTVHQDEIDTDREEYVEFQGAGLDRGVPGRGSFGAHDHNSGDYHVAVINAQFDGLLAELQSGWKQQFTVNSLYRNPVHQAYHLGLGMGESWHFYGCAADIQTYPRLHSLSPRADTVKAEEFWQGLSHSARLEGLFVERENRDPTQPTLPFSGVGHVHVDIHCFPR